MCLVAKATDKLNIAKIRIAGLDAMKRWIVEISGAFQAIRSESLRSLQIDAVSRTNGWVYSDRSTRRTKF
jgi:hypothetical protein